MARRQFAADYLFNGVATAAKQGIIQELVRRM
jgi:hypothetical protein